MSWPKTPEHGHAKLGDKPPAAERSIMTNQQEAPKSTALDGKTELFHVLGHPLLVRAVDFNRLYAEKERLAALVEVQQPTQAADSELEDAERLKEAAGLLEELAEHGSYSIEYDGRMIPICPECGEQEGDHRPDCAFARAKAFLAARKRGEIK